MPGCLSDIGYTAGETLRANAVKAGANIRRVASAAIAVDNAMQLINNYQDQRDIAQRSQNIARAQQDQIQGVFWPREAQFLAEFSTPEAIEEIEVMGRRYGGRLVSSIAAQFAQALKDAKCSFPRYCTSANAKTLQDLMMARSLAIANARVLGRNIAFAEWQARNDRNYNRRLQAVSLGRGLINEAMSLYAAAGRGLASVGAEISANLNSALESFGYANRTPRGGDPETFTQSAYARSPREGFSQATGGQTVNGFGLESSTDAFFANDVSNVMTHEAPPNSSDSAFSLFNNRQAERNNRGDVGNDNLAPQGMFTFPVAGITGGSVTVDLGMFQLGYVDDKSPGEFNTPF